MIELTEEQVELVSGGDTYYDIGKAVGTFCATYAPYSMGVTSYTMYKVVMLFK